MNLMNFLSLQGGQSFLRSPQDEAGLLGGPWCSGAVLGERWFPKTAGGCCCPGCPDWRLLEFPHHHRCHLQRSGVSPAQRGFPFPAISNLAYFSFSLTDEKGVKLCLIHIILQRQGLHIPLLPLDLQTPVPVLWVIPPPCLVLSTFSHSGWVTDTALYSPPGWHSLIRS